MAELPNIILRGGKKGLLSLRYWVPTRFRTVEKRKEIFEALHTSDPVVAMERALIKQAEIEAELNAKLAQAAPRTEREYRDAIVALAESKGYKYRSSEDLIAGPLEELVGRMERLVKDDPKMESPAVVDALLGGVEASAILVSALPEFYEHERRTYLSGKSDDERRKWRNPFKLATANFIEVVEDKPVIKVTEADATALLDWWKDRVADGEVLSDTANKNLGHIRSLIRAHDHKFCRNKRVNPFFEMKVEGGSKVPKTRREFSVEWIRDTLLCNDPLPGLNEEARDVLIIMACTGCSPSEITGVLPHHMHLDAPIPCFELKEEGRKLKNKHRIRVVVLVEPALSAMRRHRDGFVRYRYTSNFSDAANKFLGENNLLPSDDHVVYSLRHSFEGRMKRAKIDNRLRAEMMGHSIKQATGREVYGDRMTLDEKLEVLRQIEIPSAV